jgi:hypothetical protein
MKASSKAALLSAFIFPGTGQLYLKRYWQGLLIMIVAAVGLGYIVWKETVSALSRIDTAMQSGNTSVEELTKMLAAKSTGTSAYDSITPLVIIGCWIISIVDAYISGKRRDLQDASASKS